MIARVRRPRPRVLQSARWRSRARRGRTRRFRLKFAGFPQVWKTLWKSDAWHVGSRDMSANVWDHVLAKVEGKINRHSFYTWFKPTSFIADDGQALTIRVPNPLFKDWLTKHYAVVLSEALREAGRPDAVLTFLAGVAEVAEAAADAAEDPAVAGIAGRHRAGPEPALHLRHLHRRPVEPVRPRGLPRRRRGAVAVLQPALHLRRRRPRQDAPDARHRAVRRAARAGAAPHLHLVRAVHERDDQRRPLRPHPRVPRALSLGRRAARRRHPVRRRQGRHAERVLPHLQRALRRAEADRPQQRSAAPRNSAARRAPAFALRVGPHRRRPAAQPRDQGGDPEEKGRYRGDSAARQRGDVHRHARSSRTSASSKARSSACSPTPR